MALPLLLAFLIHPAFAAQTPPPTASQDPLESARALLAADKPEQAIAAFEAILANHPRSSAALAGLAAAYAAVGDPRAETSYERAIAEDPRNLPLRTSFAEYLWSVRRFEKGNREMERVIAAAPGNPKLKAHYGVNLADQGRFAQAAEQLNAARQGGLDNAEVLYYLGSALWETGRLEEARQRLHQSVLLSPEKVAARHRLGRLLLFLGKPAEAATELSFAAKLAPDSAEVALDFGRALEATGRIAEAEAEYRKALELEPSLSVTHYTLGTLLARAGKREEAQKHIALYREYFQKEQERRFQIGSRQAELNLGFTMLDAGRAQEALAQFQRRPDDPEALRGAASALSKLGRHSEAARMLEHALLLDPDNRSLRYALDREREQARR